MGHVSVCRFCHAPGPPSRERRPNTVWLGLFDDKHLAADAGTATGRRLSWGYCCRNYTEELPISLPPSRGSEHLHRQVPRVAPDRYQGDQPAGRRGNPRTGSGEGADHREIVGNLVDDQQHIAPGSD
jgi:hypothetical protein